MEREPLIALALVFAPLSLTAFGGGTAVVSEIQHQTVDVHQWATAEQFLGLFAISRGAPGPGSMLATLVGWQAAGWLGAVVATIAMFAPAALICGAAAAIAARHRGKAWLNLLERSVAPVGAGLMLAGVASITQIAATSIGAVVIGTLAGVAYYLRQSISLLMLIVVGAVANAGIMALGL